MRLTLSIRAGQVGGIKRGLEHTFDEAGGLIGRNASCDWQIEDATRTLSGRHATISFRDGHFYLTDTSTNGVYVGDAAEPLGRGRSVEIAQGTRLRFGDYMVVAALQEDGWLQDTHSAPRMSIAPDAAPRSLGMDPLDMLKDGTGQEALSMVSQRSQPAARPSASQRTGEGRRTTRDDTLGSFFGSNTPQRKDDPFSDLGKSSTGTPGTGGGGRVGTDWLAAETAYDRRDAVQPPVQQPVQRPAAPQRPAPSRDIGSRLSDALASELDEPSRQPVRQSVRQAPSHADTTSYAAQPEAPAPAATTGGGASADGALPHDLSWEDLLGGGGPPAGDLLSPMSPTASGAAALPPLPMEDLLSGTASPAAATSVPPAPAASNPTQVPQPAATRVPAEGDAGVAPRQRRAPGNNLLSNLVTPATGGAKPAPATGAGGALDPVSVLRERASHRGTQIGADPAAPLPAPTAVPAPPAAAVGTAGSYDAVLKAAGIDPATVPEADREAFACEIGRTAKAAAAGLSDVLAARRLFKEEFRLDRTQIQPEKNNPFKFYETGQEALAKAAGGAETGFLSVSAAMAEGFTDLKAHEMASVTAMQEVIATVLAKLDPASIQAEDAAGGFFGRGDGKALWERYKELHAGLSQDPETTSRKIVSEQFLRAYEKTLATLRAKDRP